VTNREGKRITVLDVVRRSRAWAKTSTQWAPRAAGPEEKA
jgi:hypothetical protein